VESNVLTFSWLVPILIAVIGVLCGLLINSIRRNVETSLKTIVDTITRLEETLTEHIKKIEELDLDKRIAILESEHRRLTEAHK